MYVFWNFHMLIMTMQVYLLTKILLIGKPIVTSRDQ